MSDEHVTYERLLVELANLRNENKRLRERVAELESEREPGDPLRGRNG